MTDAAIEFRSERHLGIGGAQAPDPWDPIAGAYATADGWVRLHTNFAHHRDGLLRLLGVANDRAEVACALTGWRAEELEDRAAAAGLCATCYRDFATWDASPQGRAVADLPLVDVSRIGDAAPRPLAPAARPLGGVRVVELARIIAGPVAGRTLAGHGADVLRLKAPRLPTIDGLDIDTGRGKRSAFLDLDTPEGPAQLDALLAEADILIDAYRPGALAARGFGAEDLARRHPGLIIAELSAYGHLGPWARRRGFDSLTQTATGLNHAEAEAAGVSLPKPLPAQALDHGAGHLLAFGVIAALMRRLEDGGSWRVRVALAGVGHWLRSFGRVEGGPGHPEPTADQVAARLVRWPMPGRAIEAIGHAARMSATPVVWTPPEPYGASAAAWG
jgi:hypothetical protein